MGVMQKFSSFEEKLIPLMLFYYHLNYEHYLVIFSAFLEKHVRLRCLL